MQGQSLTHQLWPKDVIPQLCPRGCNTTTRVNRIHRVSQKIKQGDGKQEATASTYTKWAFSLVQYRRTEYCHPLLPTNSLSYSGIIQASSKCAQVLLATYTWGDLPLPSSLPHHSKWYPNKAYPCAGLCEQVFQTGHINQWNKGCYNLSSLFHRPECCLESGRRPAVMLPEPGRARRLSQAAKDSFGWK